MNDMDAVREACEECIAEDSKLCPRNAAIARLVLAMTDGTIRDYLRMSELRDYSDLSESELLEAQHNTGNEARQLRLKYRHALAACAREIRGGE